jgi:hypothetical protein
MSEQTFYKYSDNLEKIGMAMRRHIARVYRNSYT